MTLPSKSENSNSQMLHQESQPVPSTSFNTLPQEIAPNEEIATTSVADKQPCPICGDLVLTSLLPSHASTCGDWGCSDPYGYADIMYDEEENNSSEQEEAMGRAAAEEVTQQELPTEMNQSESITLLKDIINNLRIQQLMPNETLPIRLIIRRKSAWSDYLQKRNAKWFDAKKNLKIRFIGEPAVDTGGPLREFFSETMGQMIVRLFEEGDDIDYGRKPSSNTFALVMGRHQH
eukprot:Seg1890.4 transcript_id=Seg1890.4/GoldUCD/mRNA.D3Y31 product="hypothetical protein" pseudo=true protein_id=Seg1890.4/GoldUCD/D3Y31